MIRRDRQSVSEPTALAASGSPAAAERVKATSYYSQLPMPATNIEFEVYSHASVREALGQLFAMKCAYCEGVTQGMFPFDVEHFRPKGRIIEGDGTLVFPGYWWLAAEWSNLLPSCIDCNRARYHHVPGEEKFKFGKENMFPLHPQSVRASSPGEEINEHPLLLDPCFDDPATHLTFNFSQEGLNGVSCAAEPLEVLGSSERAKASIQVYGLNRPGLIDERGKRVLLLAAALKHLQRLWVIAKDSSSPETANKIIEECRVELRAMIRSYLNPKAPYAAACRAYYRAWKSTIRPAGSST